MNNCGCGNNNLCDIFGGGSTWILILIILAILYCNGTFNTGCGCGCGNTGCGCGNTGCGCGCN